jgi:hypothetical protein
MKLSRLVPALIVTISLAGCGDDDEASIRERPNSGLLADSAVLAQMRDTGTVNRLVYDPAPDLSLTSAQQRRPDIFRPPAPAAAPAARRDTSTPANRTPQRQ